MRTNGYQNYFKDEVLSASPVKLVELLCRGALEAIVSAKRYLRLGDIGARSRAITKAMAIITHLSLSLDYEQGGELSRNLARLYGYIERLLIQANSQQCEPPLAEAEQLVATLLEAWTTLAHKQPTGVPDDSKHGQISDLYQPTSCAC